VFFSPSSPYAGNRAHAKIKFPRDLKNIVLYFFLSIVAYWALQYVADVILRFMKTFGK
jgi:hypothetical protein